MKIWVCFLSDPDSSLSQSLTTLPQDLCTFGYISWHLHVLILPYVQVPLKGLLIRNASLDYLHQHIFKNTLCSFIISLYLTQFLFEHFLSLLELKLQRWEFWLFSFHWHWGLNPGPWHERFYRWAIGQSWFCGQSWFLAHIIHQNLE